MNPRRCWTWRRHLFRFYRIPLRSSARLSKSPPAEPSAESSDPASLAFVLHQRLEGDLLIPTRPDLAGGAVAQEHVTHAPLVERLTDLVDPPGSYVAGQASA